MTNYSKITLYKKFTNLYVNIWKWISDKQNVYKVGAIGVLATLAFGVIPLIKDFFSTPPKAIEINAPITSGHDTYVAGRDISLGASPEKVAEIASALTAKYEHKFYLQQGVIDEKNVVIESLKETINAFLQGQYGSKKQNESALNALAIGDTAEAKKLLTEAARKVESDAKEGAKTYIHLGSLAYLDNTQEAIMAYRRASELDSNNPEALNMLGILLSSTGDYAGAERYLKRVESYGITHNSNLYTSIAYSNLGNVYQKQKKFDLAIDYLNKAIKIDKVSKNIFGLSQSYGGLASLYLEPEIRNLSEAYKYIQLSISLSKNNAGTVAVNLQMLSAYYSILEDWPKAINATLRSLYINESLGRKFGMVDDYHNLALFYLVYKNRDEALKFTNKCLDLAKKEGFEPEIGLCYKVQGTIYEKKGDIGKAKISYQLSLDTFNKISDSAEITTVQNMINLLKK